ncbi:cobalamin B12-binding domain-containing protein [Candidatus Micrarchaeota archaeon]|nr:cobalamin B12-binding domain-containing protein [Candidatus Micrarchaeota archaeon]
MTGLLYDKIKPMRAKGEVSVALVSCPTPVLLDKNGRPYSPVRTNYFPQAQVLLGTEAKCEMEKKGIKGDVKVVDLKSVEEPDQWRSNVQEYGALQYGDKTLTKFFVGDGMDRVHELEGFDIIGITSNFTAESAGVIRVIERIRQINNNAILLVGGRDANARPEFYRNAGADIVALGDSDASFPNFVCDTVMGKRIMLTPLELLNSQPFRGLPQHDFSLLPNLHRYRESGSGYFFKETKKRKRPKVAYIELSRGCDRDCNFCDSRLTKRKNFEIEFIKENIRNHKRNGVGILLFSDDNLLQWLNSPNGEKELIELFEFLRAEGMAWEFSVGLEVGRFFDTNGKLRKELLEAMFWNNGDPENWQGAFRTLIPLENPQSTERRYKKLRSWEDEMLVMEAIVRMGIPQINIGIMLGWPEENWQSVNLIRTKYLEIRKMVEGANARQDLVVSGTNLSLFCVMPLPNTPLHDEMIGQGRIVYPIEEHPELVNIFTSVIRGDHFRPEEITDIRMNLINGAGSEQPEGKVKFQGRVRDEKERELRAATGNFDFALAEVIDTYLAGNENLIYHTDKGRKLLRANELKESMEKFRGDWRRRIKDRTELYKKILELEIAQGKTSEFDQKYKTNDE